MRTGEPNRISIILLCLIAFFIVMLVAPTWATEVIQSNDQNLQTTGDVNTGGNETFGFAHSLGDVDLNQCMGSTQWGTILVSKQKLVLNKWCAADSLDSKGMYKAAAMLRCSIKEVSKVLGSTCIDALTVHADEVTSVPMTDEGDSDDDENERYELLYARLIDLEAQGMAEAERAEKAARRANTAAQRANKAETDRKQYAQDLYEELQEWN